MSMYRIAVNGIPFCEAVEEHCKDYLLGRLALFPDLKVDVIEEQREVLSIEAGHTGIATNHEPDCRTE